MSETPNIKENPLSKQMATVGKKTCLLTGRKKLQQAQAGAAV